MLTSLGRLGSRMTAVNIEVGNFTHMHMGVVVGG